MTTMVLHNPTWHSATVVYTDQLFCHCVFIYPNFHWQLVFLLRDGSQYCFRLIAESYENNQSINQSINNQSICFDLFIKTTQWFLLTRERCFFGWVRKFANTKKHSLFLWQLKALGLLKTFEELALILLSWLCDDVDLHISVYK